MNDLSSTSALSNGMARLLKEVRSADGSWQSYPSYDSQGRPLVVLRGFDSDVTTNANLCLSTEYSYASLDASDNLGVEPTTPRTETEKFKGAATAITYRVLTPALRKDIRCVSTAPAPSYTNANDLVTLTRYFTNGVNLRKVQSVAHPDGTMTFYDYATTATNATTTVTTGQPGAAKTNIVDGTLTVSIVGALGQALTNRTEAIRPGSTNIVLAQETYSNFDEFQRPERVTHLDGSYEETFYDCCGIGSTRDRLGVTTQYFVDDLKRPTASRRLLITTTNVLDAAGRVIETRRFGTDGNTIVQGRFQYGPEGSVKQEITALGATNTFSEAFTNGFLVKSTAYQDGGTRVETFYRDGRLKRVEGTATMPVRYEYGIQSSGEFTNRFYTQEIKLTTGGADTSEWTKTFEDGLGRTLAVVYPDNASSRTVYNTLGQVTQQVDPDGVTTVFAYNAKGEQEYAGVELNGTAEL